MEHLNLHITDLDHLNDAIEMLREKGRYTAADRLELICQELEERLSQKNIEQSVAEAIALAGSAKKLGRMLEGELTDSAVNLWRKRGVPPSRALEIVDLFPGQVRAIDIVHPRSRRRLSQLGDARNAMLTAAKEGK